MNFSKPALTVDEQIELLSNRGMAIEDQKSARDNLTFISFHRLKVYWEPFEVLRNINGNRAFREGACFDDVLKLYRFDRKLRLLVLDAIEVVEIALRTTLANYMAECFGPHGYLEMKHYKTREINKAKRSILYRLIQLLKKFDNIEPSKKNIHNINNLIKAFERSKAPNAVHYRKKYDYPKEPPIWLAMETIPLGLLTRIYSGLKLRKDKQAIAEHFDLDQRVFTSFVIHISHIRNICAHHGRLWNRKFPKELTLSLPKKHSQLGDAMSGANPHRLHNTLIILDYLLNIIAHDYNWRTQIQAHLLSCHLVDLVNEMGFAEPFRSSYLWQT